MEAVYCITAGLTFQLICRAVCEYIDVTFLFRLSSVFNRHRESLWALHYYGTLQDASIGFYLKKRLSVWGTAVLCGTLLFQKSLDPPTPLSFLDLLGNGGGGIKIKILLLSIISYMSLNVTVHVVKCPLWQIYHHVWLYGIINTEASICKDHLNVAGQDEASFSLFVYSYVV